MDVDTVAAVEARTVHFRALVQDVREAGTDSLEHFGNGYTHAGGYALQQNPEELAAFVYLLRERTRIGHARYLEIGSASGGTLRFLAERVSFKGRMWSIDDKAHPRSGEQWPNWRDIDVSQICGDSHSLECAALAHRDLGPPVLTVVFIDGDHTYAGVTADVALVRRYLSAGSLIAFHDTVANEDVKRAFEETATTSGMHAIAHYVGAEKPLGIGVVEVL
jgi:cephalosporin hydroxylase